MWHKMVEVHRSVLAQAQKENLATPTRAVSFNLFFTLMDAWGKITPSYVSGFLKKKKDYAKLGLPLFMSME